MKHLVLCTAMLGAMANASASEPLYQMPDQPATGLWVPTIVSMPQGDTRGSTFSVDVLNVDPAFAANLAVSVTPNQSRPDAGALNLVADTCSGATLAQNGQCRLRFNVRAACAKSGMTTWFVTVHSAAGVDVTTQVQVANKPGKCD
jgi:hypothetical protein